MTLEKSWMLGPFERSSFNPLLGPEFSPVFDCPMSGHTVRWEARAIVGAASVLRDGKVCLIYQAEDYSAGYERERRDSPGIMRMGLATSEDGFHFERHSKPVLFPTEDAMRQYEWPGGCEIPRLVEGPDHVYYLYYSALQRDPLFTRLSVATSTDLVHWDKKGLAFGKADGGRYKDLWSKSGAVITELVDGRLIAARIQGKFWMYFGESALYAAWSDNLIDWTPVTIPAGAAGEPYRERSYEWERLKREQDLNLLPIMDPRPEAFDNGLVEGGVAVLTGAGIVHIYNCRHTRPDGFDYGPAQALFDAHDPTRLLDRATTPTLWPSADYELRGIVPNVIFATGLVRLKDRWHLYFNGADWLIGAATAPA